MSTRLTGLSIFWLLWMALPTGAAVPQDVKVMRYGE